MADIYNPSIAGSRSFGTYMNQYGATSGRVPSAKLLDDIIQGELDAAYNNMYRNKQLQLQKAQFEEAQRQFNVGQTNAADTSSATRQAGLVGTGLQTLGTLGGSYLLSGMGKTGATAGATGLGAFQPGAGVIPQTNFLGLGGAAIPQAEFMGLTAPATTAAFGGGVPMGSLAFPELTSAGATTLGSSAVPAVQGASSVAGGIEGLYGLGGLGTETATAATPTFAEMATGAMNILGPAAAGYAGSTLGGSLLKSYADQLPGGERETSFVGKVGGGAAGGAAIGSIVPGVGTAIGAGIGATVGLIDWSVNEGGQMFREGYNSTIGKITGSTWLCTEVSNRIGLSEDDHVSLKKLRRYTLKNHREWLRQYIVKGKKLVREINKQEEELLTFYATLKESMVLPIIDLIRNDKLEEAFEMYRDETNKLIRQYAPQLKEGIE
jgi:hypothetical protein